jgi:WD40-like Beta Propeller Repeat
MNRHGTLILLALFCASCGSSPAPQANANLATQTPRAATSASTVNARTQQGTTQPESRIQPRAFAIPAPAETPKPPIAHEAVVTIPGAQSILRAAASPTAEEIFVLAQTSRDTYGGTFFVVRLDGREKQVESVMGAMNLYEPDAPVWSPDGEVAYFTFDTEKYDHPESTYDYGLFAWDRSSAKTAQIMTDAVGGLALSPDGTLAAFWDYSAGDKLTVFDLKKKQVVRTWQGQVHHEDDLVFSDLAFTPDGKSLLARLYAPVEFAVRRYDIESGKISPFAQDVQSLMTLGDTLYLLQFVPVPFSATEHPHRLTKWTAGATEPATVLGDFHYERLSGNGNGWLIGETAEGWNRGAAVYDTKTGQIQTAGTSCGSAVVTYSGRILYIFGNEFVADPAVCSGPPPKRD